MMIYITHALLSKVKSACEVLCRRQFLAVLRIFCVKKLEDGSSLAPGHAVNHIETNSDTGWFLLSFFLSYHIISYRISFVIPATLIFNMARAAGILPAKSLYLFTNGLLHVKPADIHICSRYGTHRGSRRAHLAQQPQGQ